MAIKATLKRKGTIWDTLHIQTETDQVEGLTALLATMSIDNLSDITDVVINTPSDGQVITRSGANWVNGAPNTHTHTKSQITDFGSYEPLNANIQTHIGTVTGNPHNLDAADVGARASTWVPSWTDVTSKPTTFAPIIGSGAADAVAGNDARLTDARTPLSHTLASHTVSGLTTGHFLKATAAGAFAFAAHGLTASDVSARASTWVPSWTDVTSKPTTVAGYAMSDFNSSVEAVSPSGARPASDVYAWAKAATKPSYTYSEVGAEPANTNIQTHIGTQEIHRTIDDSVISTTTLYSSSKIDTLAGEVASYADGLVAPKANTASPTFTGIPAAPTAAAGTNTTQIATTAFVGTAVSAIIDAAPGTLDTLNELAAALGDDPNFATTVTTEIGTKVTANTAITGATKAKITYDSKGLVTSGADLAEADIPTLAATKITQTASYRFVTDTEKGTWNAKEPAITKGTTAQYFRGNMSLATMPTSLPASDVSAWAKATTKPSYTLDEVTVGTTNLHVTQTEKNTWNGKMSDTDVEAQISAYDATITTQLSNASTAYGWGNHAGLYRPVAWVPAWTDVTSKPTTFAPIIGSGAADAVAGNDSRLTNSRPASDVYAWAKAATQPAPITHNQAWSTITSKPTTLSGYGITDGLTAGNFELSGTTLIITV